MGISIRAYARHRGVTDTAVHKAIRAGRITPEADGTIDADRADREWARNSDAPKTGTRADVEKLEDLMVDYLGLSVVWQSLRPRKDGANDEVLLKRIAALQAQLQNPTLPAEEARQLRTALAEYTEAANRARRLAVRRSALEATLISMPDKLEEVYQLVMSSPYSSGMDGKLEESLARLRIAEEVAAEFGAAESMAFDRPAQAAAPAEAGQTERAAARARQAQDWARK